MSSDVNLSILSVEKFNVIWNNTIIGLCFVDLQGNIIKCNPYLSELLNYSEHELIGQSIRNLIHYQDAASDQSMSTRLLSGEIDVYIMVQKYNSKTGEIIQCKIRNDIIKDSDGNVLHFIYQIIPINDGHLYLDQIKENIQELSSLVANAKNLPTEKPSVKTKIYGVIKDWRLAIPLMGFVIWLGSQYLDYRSAISSNRNNTKILQIILKNNPELINNIIQDPTITIQDINQILEE